MGDIVDTGFGSVGVTDDARPLQKRIHDTKMRQLFEVYGWPEDKARAYADAFMAGANTQRHVSSLVSRYQLGDKRVLEIGSGLGNTLLEFHRQGIGAIGLEPGKEWHDIVASRLTAEGFDPGHVTQGIGESLPFDDNSFDFVISMQVLEHVQEPETVLSEIHRVLRPGGVTHIAAPNYFSFAENHYRVAWFPGLSKRMGAFYLGLRGRNPHFYLNHINNITYARVIRTLRELGMEDLRLDELLAKGRSANAGRGLQWLAYRALCSAGGWPMRLAYHAARTFRSEISYVYRKPES